MTTFGTSAAYIAALHEGRGRARRRPRPLAAARVGSTGSPLSPEGFQWVYEHVGEDTWLFSTSGGTDVCTAFVGGVPLLPVYQGELQGRALGAAVEAWDEDGNAVVGEVGELVITEPMPSMPIYFWDDAGRRALPRGLLRRCSPASGATATGSRSPSAAPRSSTGRSDSTINRGGIRMGTAEIYRAVLALDEITDALVVDIPREGEDAWMPLFVVLREGAELDDDLDEGDRASASARTARRATCRTRSSQVDEVPRTLSGKVLEVPVKRILMGTPPEKAASRDSLANPEALDWFVELAAEARQALRQT